MERLTTNKSTTEMNMLELAHNCCYVKDRNARYRDFEMDMDARELTRQLLKDHTKDSDAFESDEEFDEWMIDYLQNGIDTTEGLIALFYRNLWAMAELREQLKSYEDAEEQGLLLRLPCPIGAKIYFVGCDFIEECTFKDFKILKSGVWAVDGYEIIGLFGDCVFPSKEEAEQKLAEMKEGAE
jgi:hypothetical protein